jgi:hypothetical protein
MKNRDEMFCLDTSTFNGGLGIPPPQLRPIAETMAEVDKARAEMLKNERYRSLVAPRNCVGRLDHPYFTGIVPSSQDIKNATKWAREYMEANTSPFATHRALNHNNELLLLL